MPDDDSLAESQRIVGAVQLTEEQIAAIKKLTDRTVTKLEFVDIANAGEKSLNKKTELSVRIACW